MLGAFVLFIVAVNWDRLKKTLHHLEISSPTTQSAFERRFFTSYISRILNRVFLSCISLVSTCKWRFHLRLVIQLHNALRLYLT